MQAYRLLAIVNNKKTHLNKLSKNQGLQLEGIRRPMNVKGAFNIRGYFSALYQRPFVQLTTNFLNFFALNVAPLNFTWQEALSLGFEDLFLGQGNAIKLQTEELSSEIASTFSCSTKSNRIVSGETHSSQTTPRYRKRVYPQRCDSRSLIISSTDVIPRSVFKPVGS